MRLIGESTIACNLCQGQSGLQHESLSAFYPASQQECVRREAERLLERAREMRNAQAGQARERLTVERRIEIRIDMRRNTSYLPWREATAKCRRGCAISENGVRRLAGGLHAG
jgi:hypothetical protein